VARALLKDKLWHADGKSLDVARKDMWALMQAVAKPELRKVFAAMHSRPCWLDTGKYCVAIDIHTLLRTTSAALSIHAEPEEDDGCTCPVLH